MSLGRNPIAAFLNVMLMYLRLYVWMWEQNLQMIECTVARYYNLSSKADRGDIIVHNIKS